MLRSALFSLTTLCIIMIIDIYISENVKDNDKRDIRQPVNRRQSENAQYLVSSSRNIMDQAGKYDNLSLVTTPTRVLQF